MRPASRPKAQDYDRAIVEYTEGTAEQPENATPQAVARPRQDPRLA